MTALNSFKPLLELALEIGVQVEPFQCSARVIPVAGICPAAVTGALAMDERDVAQVIAQQLVPDLMGQDGVGGIAVTVQKDNGQQVTIAQYDDGDVQMGDRVAIVYDSNGTPRAVRDTGYRRD